MSEPAPEISVVVATRGRTERLGMLLDSLAAQTLPAERFEAIVVIDGPDPASERAVRERQGGGLVLRLIARERSGGPAAARNQGWRAAAAPLVAFTDDDCEATPQWLAELLAAATDHPGTLIQGPTLPNPREAHRDGPFARSKEITEAGSWFQTCNIAYPRALLERLEGFDERFTEAAGEDVDLGWRALEVGAGTGFRPAAVVHHAVEEIGPLGYLRLARRGADSAWMYRRHPELRRREAYRHVFWKRSHARLLLALAGLLLARRFPPAALLAVPYLKGLRGRAAAMGGKPALLAPYLLAYDAVDVSTAVRGSLRHRILLL
jgi:GT2 family glycosyltransferase